MQNKTDKGRKMVLNTMHVFLLFSVSVGTATTHHCGGVRAVESVSCPDGESAAVHTRVEECLPELCRELDHTGNASVGVFPDEYVLIAEGCELVPGNTTASDLTNVTHVVCARNSPLDDGAPTFVYIFAGVGFVAVLLASYCLVCQFSSGSVQTNKPSLFRFPFSCG